MMYRSKVRLSVAVLLLMLVCEKSSAQPLIARYTALEALIAPAVFVAIGHIESVQENADVRPNVLGRVSDGQDRLGYIVTTKFDSILKNVARDGKLSSNDRQFQSFQIVDKAGRNAHIAGLVENKTKGLWLIRAKEESDSLHRWSFLPFDELGVNEFGYRGGSLNPPMLASDFSVLTTHEQILQRIKQYASISQNQHRFDQPAVASAYVPFAVLRQLGDPRGSHQNLDLPIDSELPRTVRRMIESPEELLSEEDAKDLWSLDAVCLAGIDLTASMKTEASIQLLKDCLDDSVLPFQGSSRPDDIRIRAYESLLSFQVNPPMPAFASRVTKLFVGRLSLPEHVRNINDDALAVVAEFENLESLTLWGTRVTESGINHLGKLKKLNHLRLYDKQVTDDILQTLAANHQLHTLGQGAMKDYSRPGSALDVDSIRFDRSPFTDAGVKQLRQLRNLTRIELTNMQITDASIESLLAFKQLKSANLFGTKVTEEGLAKLRKGLPSCNWQLNW